MYNIEYLKEFFKDDLFAMKRLGAEIVEAHNDYAKCRVEITKEHFNAKGIVMGGAVFSLADFTFAVATNQNEDYNTVSTTASISYVRPATGKYLYAEAIKLRDGKTVCFYDIFIYNDSDTVVAKASISGTHVYK